MGAISDVTSEFKQAGPKEKAMIVIGVIGVAGVAYYIYAKRQASSVSQGTLANSPGGSQAAGYPLAGGTPVIPSGVNPIFDPAGNLIAFQNPGSTPPPPSPPGNPPPPVPSGNPANWFTNFLGSIGYGTQIRPGGTDVNGQRFWIGSGNSNFFYAPVGSTIQQGAQGRIWITPKGGTQQLLTGPGQGIPTLSPNTTVHS